MLRQIKSREFLKRKSDARSSSGVTKPEKEHWTLVKVTHEQVRVEPQAKEHWTLVNVRREHVQVQSQAKEHWTLVNVRHEQVKAQPQEKEHWTLINVRHAHVQVTVQVREQKQAVHSPLDRQCSARLRNVWDNLETERFDRWVDYQIEDIFAYMDLIEALPGTVGPLRAPQVSRPARSSPCCLSPIAEEPEEEDESSHESTIGSDGESSGTYSDEETDSIFSHIPRRCWPYYVKARGSGDSSSNSSNTSYGTEEARADVDVDWKTAIADGMVRFERR